jgi:heme-degrading monooxygenase HmoA
MFANIATIQLRPGTSSEVSRILSESVVPDLKTQPGFKGFLLLVQPETDRAVSINLWATAKDFGAFWTNPLYSSYLGKIAASLAEVPEREQYEVAVASIAFE